MYRNTVLGTALATTLEQFDGEGAQALTEEQKAAIWEAFDIEFETMLKEVPPEFTATIRCPKPEPPTKQSSDKTNSKGKTDIVRRADVEYPLYRCVDGKWTIVLQNPTVTLTGDGGEYSKETFKLDFLTIEAEQAMLRTAPTAKRGRTSAGGAGGSKGKGRKRGRSPG